MMHVFHTVLDIQECKERMRDSVNRGVSVNSSILDGDMLKGSIDEKNDTFWLMKNNNQARNSFARAFHGKITKQEQSTRIEGQFKVNRYVKAFVVIWFVFVAMLGGSVFLRSFGELLSSQVTDSTIMGLIFPWGMVLFGAVLVKLGINLSYKNEEDVLDFIKNTLEAKEIITGRE